MKYKENGWIGSSVLDGWAQSQVYVFNAKHRQEHSLVACVTSSGFYVKPALPGYGKINVTADSRDSNWIIVTTKVWCRRRPPPMFYNKSERG